MAASTEVAGGRLFPRLHWGAVAAGVLVALAAHIVMGLIGAAIGFAAEPADSRGLGATAAIWALITPFVATLLGAWIASRMCDAEDARTGTLHGVLVWCIGLIAGALFLAGTMATGVMSAGTAASGNAAAAQRQARAETGRSTVRGPQAQARAEDAAKGAAAGAGGGALAAIAGLLGAVVGSGIATRRRRGASAGRWRTAFRHDERRETTVHAGDHGPGATTYGTPYGTTETGRMPGTTTTHTQSTTGEGPPGDPFHH